MNAEFFDELRNNLTQGEIEIVLERLLNITKINDLGKIRNTLIIISGGYYSLKKEIQADLLDRPTKKIELAKISDSLTSIIDDLEKQSNDLNFSRASKKITLPKGIPEFAYEKIIGEKNNLKNIAWLQQGLTVEKSICRVVVGNSLGSGFLVAGNWLITNNHVIATKEEAQNTEVEFNYNEDMRGKPLIHYSYTLDASTFSTNKELDFTQVKINDNSEKPLADWGYLEFSGIAAKEGDHVTIIQHPDGGRKQIALNDNRVINIHQQYLQYTTDTLPGSSGSPVFNDNWKVVGLHHAGGSLEKNEQGDRVYANQAIRIGEILNIFKN